MKTRHNHGLQWTTLPLYGEMHYVDTMTEDGGGSLAVSGVGGGEGRKQVRAPQSRVKGICA